MYVRLAIRPYIKEVIAGILALNPGEIFASAGSDSASFYEDFSFRLRRILIKPNIYIRGIYTSSERYTENEIPYGM